MASTASSQAQRPRELRRRVVLPARMRSGAQWSDACILNISSRGLMIQTGRAAPQGSTVELRRGEHIIVAKVMWREGSRAGLQVEGQLPVEDILTLSQAPGLQLTADSSMVERRKYRRPTEEQNRLRGRAFEFISVGVIAASMALVLYSMVSQALAQPLAAVEAVLGG